MDSSGCTASGPEQRLRQRGWPWQRRGSARRQWAGVALGAVVGAAVTVSGTALAGGLAAGPAVIHACYARSNGALRVIHPARGGRCRSAESPINWNQSGPRGPQGARGPAGFGAELNLTRIATLNWWGGNFNADEYGFGEPDGIAFDGAHMWVADNLNNRVTEFNASNGLWIRTLTNAGASYGFKAPAGVAFDGSHIWVTNTGNDSVTEINPADGSLIRTISNGTVKYGLNFPDGIAFDGSHLWVTDYNGAAITEIGTDGSLIQRITDPSCEFNQPDQIAFDGSGHMWVTNNVGSAGNPTGTISEFSTSTTGSCIRVAVQPGGAGWDKPAGIASDGTHIWVAVTGGNSVLELNISDGSPIGTFSGGSYGFNGPLGIAFDGAHLWVTNSVGNSVTELSSADGSWMETFSGGGFGLSAPTGIAFDGAQMWVTNFTGNSVTNLVVR